MMTSDGYQAHSCVNVVPSTTETLAPPIPVDYGWLPQVSYPEMLNQTYVGSRLPLTTAVSCDVNGQCTGTSCYFFLSQCVDYRVCRKSNNYTEELVRACDMFVYCYHREGLAVVQTNTTYCGDGKVFDAFEQECIDEIQSKCEMCNKV